MNAPQAPRVSVVIAAYNMGQHVAATIESVLGQTMGDLEAIVVDDGSTDHTREVVRRFDGEPRVRYLYQENRGQTKAKNVGIAAARGEFIGFCDADDLWVPQKLERQLPVFERKPAVGLVYGRSATIGPDGQRTGEITGLAPSGRVLNALFIRNIVPFGTAVVRRKVLEQMGSFDEHFKMGIDWELWLRVATRWEFEFIPEPLHLYRVWAGQMSRNWRGRYDNCFRIMAKFLQEHPDLLPPHVVKEAYADSYFGRGLCHATLGGDRSSALRDYLTAVRFAPTFWPAWKAMLQLAAPRPAKAFPDRKEPPCAP